MILPRAQIETFAKNAGFSGQDLEDAVAIACAESSGNPEEYDAETAFFNEHNFSADARLGQGSCGLWQIFRHEHPELQTWNLDDPQVNACAAYLVYMKAGRRFTPWSTWTSGKYRQFLPAEAAAPEPGGVL